MRICLWSIFMVVEFMTSKGGWRKSGIHENNVRASYIKFKVNRHFDYFRRDDSDMIYRISTEIKVEDIISEFTITIEAKDIHGRTLLGSRGRLTKEAYDNAQFPIHEEEFKRAWYNIIKSAKEVKSSEIQ